MPDIPLESVERNPMRDFVDTCHLAVVQATPPLFDRDAAVDKAVALTARAAEQEAELIVFPELFVPGYPYGLTFGFSVGRREESGRRDWLRYAQASILVPGPQTDRIGAAAKAAHAFVSIGVSERDATSGTLYNTNLVFAPSGELASVHRKLKPTGAERVVWGDADRGYFPIVDTPWGPLGSLICWENYMPLARMALYNQGVSIYLAPNTNDNPEWQATVEHIAIEGRCDGVNANQYFGRGDYPTDLEEEAAVNRLPDVVCRGGSSVISPTGHTVVGPVWNSEDILTTTLHLEAVVASRMEFDVCGHYARPDVFDFSASGQ
jgi:nitrilase